MSFDVLGIIAPHPPIMVPEVGRDDARVTDASATALGEAADLLTRFGPETVVIMSPHTEAYADAFTVTTGERVSGDLGRFGAPQVAYGAAGDSELAHAIIDQAEAAGIPVAPHEGLSRRSGMGLDHGVLVPMRSLDPEGRYALVDLSFTYLPPAVHAAFGRAVRAAAKAVGRRVAFVASGDMSHRLKPEAPAGFSPRAAEFDAEVVRLVGAGDFASLADIDSGLREDAGECGWRSFLTLGGFLEGEQIASRVLSYEGPWGVGYMVAVFAPADVLATLPPRTPAAGVKGGHKGDAESAPVALARATIEAYIREGIAPEAAAPFDDAALPARAGAFVSLHKDGDLRGCIGTIAPTHDTLADEIAHNAISASTGDPRFPAVTADELDGLEIKVDVLHEPEPVDSLQALDPTVYGVITTCGYRRGLLLPDLEGVDTCEQQVAIAMSKGGIGSGEPISLERFKVDRYV
jgi:AmmeMemoRadiSam system protein A